jgi:hypothetical protein
MTSLKAILARFERKLRTLKTDDKLTTQAPTAFKQFADQVDRRATRDRRRRVRHGQRRRREEEPD